MESLLESAIKSKNTDQIKQIARSTGLFNNKLRAQSWKLLLPFDQKPLQDIELLDPHKDEDQIKLDVNRSFVYYPILKKEEEKQTLKDLLDNVLIRFFRSNPDLSYYQGLHDICTIFILIFETEEESFQYFEHFALVYLRDFMMPNLSSSVDLLHLIPELVVRFDSELNLEKIQPYYCLSPIITLFSHDIKHWDCICLIFDQIIANDSVEIIIYLYASILIYKKKQIDINEDEDVLHSILSKLLDSIEYEDIKIILPKLYKYTRLPLSKLKSYKNINKYSTIKSKSHDIEKIQTTIISNQIHYNIKQNEIFLEFFDRNTIWKIAITIGVIGIILNIVLPPKSGNGIF